MVELKTPGEIEAMAAAGAVVASALAAVQAAAHVGTRLDALDQVARHVLHENRATSPFLGYHPSFGASPFPGVVCLSVNDAVLHGLPTPYRLRESDLLSVNCGATLDGWTGDAAISFCVGTASPADAHLIENTRHALDVGIAAAQPGARLSDISAAIGQVARAAGLGLHTDFGGHGIGRTMHERPAHTQRWTGRSRVTAAARPHHRDRAVVPCRRPRRLPIRRRRLDAAKHGRLAWSALRTHHRRDRRWTGRAHGATSGSGVVAVNRLAPRS